MGFIFFMFFMFPRKVGSVFSAGYVAGWERKGKGNGRDGKGLTGDVGKEGFIYPELMGTNRGVLFYF